MKISDLIRKGQEILGKDKYFEILLVLEKVSGFKKEEILSSLEFEVGSSIERKFFRLILKRKLGFPLQYITGKTEFWSMEFKVKKGVFIPRQETELIIEKVIEFARGKNFLIGDIGTGCGNIAISLAKELPEAKILATDISSKALELSKENAKFHGMEERIRFLKGSLFKPFKDEGLFNSFDVLCSNPPYIGYKEKKSLDDDVVNFEPKRALFSGEDGMNFIKKLIKSAPLYLKENGRLYFEIGYGMEEELKILLKVWKKSEIYTDYFGRPRVFMAEL
ncbi:MAG: peptide chain release factor N(5)-glutamine methyltransferase [Candidatus Aminicenantia bacterium]